MFLRLAWWRLYESKYVATLIIDNQLVVSWLYFILSVAVLYLECCCTLSWVLLTLSWVLLYFILSVAVLYLECCCTLSWVLLYFIFSVAALQSTNRNFTNVHFDYVILSLFLVISSLAATSHRKRLMIDTLEFGKIN
jgi:hypothetical protein